MDIDRMLNGHVQFSGSYKVADWETTDWSFQKHLADHCTGAGVVIYWSSSQVHACINSKRLARFHGITDSKAIYYKSSVKSLEDIYSLIRTRRQSRIQIEETVGFISIPSHKGH